MLPEHSRTVRLAARASGGNESELEQRLGRTITHIAVDPNIQGAVACAEVLIATQQRGLGHVSIDPARLSGDDLRRLQTAATAIRPDRPVLVGDRPSGAIGVGIGAAPGDIHVVPDAHGARLSRSRVVEQKRRPSRLGVVFAAALASGEIFKDAAAIGDDHCIRHEDLVFCPVTLSGDIDYAPALPINWQPDMMLIGVGAIGTAHTLILSGLTRHGGAVLVDRQRYAVENLGTYSLGNAADVAAGRHKTELAQQTLSGWRCHRHVGDIATAVTAIDRGHLPWAPIGLSGLDNHPARRDAQRIQLDRLLDAATGDTTVGLRDTRPDGPCLNCMLPDPPAIAPTDALVALGIPLELAHSPGDAVVDDAVISLAPNDASRAVLSARRGTPICGLLRAAGMTNVAAGDYLPSVPFVSQQAACLSVGRLIAITTGIDDGLPNFFQYDAMFGPDRAIRQTRRPDPACVCQQRSNTIQQVRSERRSGRRP